MSGIVNCQNTLIANFGMPVWENPTEFMMEAVFKHEKMKYRYISTEVPKDKLKAAFEGVKAMGYKGFNCTLPHKQNIIPLLDGLGESAELMGAVNCVVERDGLYIGENTDGKGYTESLSQVTKIEGKSILILGAGGAARAIAIECALENAKKIIIVNRSKSSGQDLAELVEKNTAASGEFIQLDGEVAVPANVDIVINATNIGLYPDATKVPIDMSTLKSNMIVSDVIPNPPQTQFIKEATALGCTTIDGLGMLVNQGKIAIKYWSGKDVNADVMRQALVDLFN
ncbi:shikimate dehydrogenase [Lentisphaera profundi]|uniref:Shikimate dehydrogenase (NADP(+)) n=1 Tax=Lentisphaera profundi TaxID=1658616 RepID=A0ABY7VU22_9BACT|nr:shikimate dehydrogenase [Lentisphaera profundi]WDE97698.1 shikimate dehydrogenase [Lentisphaera profundi]